MRSMKNLLMALCLLAIACTKSTESIQPTEIQTKGKPSHGGGGVDNSIPQVTGLSATAVGSTQINLSWSSVAGATTYWIYRDNYVPAIITSTSYSDKTVSPGTTYTYAIAAVVNSTLGPKSAPVTVTTPQ